MYPCERPLPMWDNQDGEKPYFGKYRDEDRARYGSPAREFCVSCGKCPSCIMNRSADWATRIMHETKLWEPETCWFITLTYSPQFYPDRGYLYYRHIQLFLKRLRHEYGPGIRFVVGGEYGTRTHRPHWHLILFNLHLTDLRVAGKSRSNVLYDSPSITKIWGRGIHNVIGKVTAESAAYVARYQLKGGVDAWHPPDWTDPYGKVHKAPREMFKTSLKPGIGMMFFRKFESDFFPQDVCVTNGHPGMPPRAYLKDYEARNPEQAAMVRAKRIERLSDHEADLTPERRIVRGKVALARLKFGKDDPGWDR